MSINVKKERQIYEYLITVGCCVRCCLRLSGVRTFVFYADPARSAFTVHVKQIIKHIKEYSILAIHPPENVFPY